MSSRFAFTALAGLLSLQSGADALYLPTLRSTSATAARAPFARMDALTELEALKAQLAELEQAKLAMQQAKTASAAALEQAQAMQEAAMQPAVAPVAEVVTTPVPEVVATPIAVPAPAPAPIPAPELALPSAPVPELSIPSITPEQIAAALPSMPEVPNVLPVAKAVAPAAADAVSPLLIDAAVVVSLPLLAVGITAYVGLLTGGSDADKLAAVADPGPAEKSRGMGVQPMGEQFTTPGSRSAPEIFFGGLENLGKEPFGWFFPSSPTPLHGASLAPATPQQAAGRQMGAKELARAQAVAPPPQDDYAAIVAAEFRQKNLMAGADGLPMSGVVAPTAGIATPKPPPVAPPPEPVAVAPPPKPVAVAAASVAAATVAPPKTVPPPPKTAPPPPKTAPPPLDTVAAATVAPPKTVPPPPKTAPPPLDTVPPPPMPVAVAPPVAEPAEAAPVQEESAEEAPATSAAERMLQLKELLEDGLLSQAEYDEKRLDILNSI